MARSPESLGREYSIRSTEIRAAAEALGLGRWIHRRLFLLEESEVDRLRPVLERMVARRRERLTTLSA